MANVINAVSLQDLNVLLILKNVNNTLELLDNLGDRIIPSINEMYYPHARLINSGLAKTNSKRVDSFKNSRVSKIKEIRQDVWDDYYVLTKIVADLMDDIPDYERSKIEIRRAKQYLPSYSSNFKAYQFEVIEKRERKFIACENRIKKNINNCNRKIASFNALKTQLLQQNICYNNSSIGFSDTMNEFRHLITDTQNSFKRSVQRFL